MPTATSTMTDRGRPRRILPVCLLVLVALGAAACGSSAGTANGPSDSLVADGTPTPQRGNKLVYGIEADPNGLDPSKNGWDPSGLLAANAIFDTVAAFDANGTPRPYLAESIAPNADFTVWTIKLRPGVTFHDGTPLTAAAAKRNGDALLASPITGPASSLIDQIVPKDDLTYEVRTKAPWASYPVLLTGQGGVLAAPSQLDNPDGASHPVGTGPFKLQRWDVDQSIQLVRNPSYWRQGLPYLDAVELRPITDTSRRIDDLEAGTIDALHDSDFKGNARLDDMAKAGTVKVVREQGTTSTNMVMFNTTKAPLDDVRVRQAVAYATDINALADQLGWPKDHLADSPFAPTSPFYAKADFPRFDLDKAKRLVAEYQAEKGPISFKLANTPAPESLQLLQALSDQWAKAGITTTIDAVDFKQFVIRAVAGQYDAAVFRYFGYPDPDGNWHFWSSKTIKPSGEISLNFTRLADAELDKALDAGRASPDVATRKQAYTEVQKRFSALVPYLWIYRTDWVIAGSSKVHDLANGPLPDGQPSLPMSDGAHRLTQTWKESA